MFSAQDRHAGGSDEDGEFLIDSESDPDQGDGSWEIKKVNGHKFVNGKLHYHVKWKVKHGKKADWPESENWVPAEQLDAPELLHIYKTKLPSKRRANLRRLRQAKHALEVKKKQTKNLEGFVVSDDEVDKPKKNKHRHRRTVQAHSSRKSPEKEEESDRSEGSSDKEKSRWAAGPSRARQSSEDSTADGTGESGSSIRSFVVSDTEEGLLIPGKPRKPKDRTPSPVVVSRRKKPTWQETFGLQKKDNFIFNSSDSDPDIVSDDEERHEAFLHEAKADMEKKEKERAEKRRAKKAKEVCREKSPARQGLTTSESSSSNDDAPSPRRRRRSSSNDHVINVDHTKVRQQAKKMQNQPLSSKHKRGIVDNRSDGLNLSRAKLNELQSQLKIRQTSNGVYKAKESLLQSDELHGRSSPPSENSCTSSSGSRELSVDDQGNMPPQLQQWENPKGFMPPREPIEDIGEDVAIIDDNIDEQEDHIEDIEDEESDEHSDDHGTGRPQRVQGRVIAEIDLLSDTDEEEEIDRDVDEDDSESEEEDEEFDSDDQDEDMSDNAEEAMQLPTDDPLFDTFERFARECMEFKYNAMANNLKPVYVIQFFQGENTNENGETEEVDLSMVVFENKEGARPKHVCECVPTEQMLDEYADLVVDAEHRLGHIDALPLHVANNIWQPPVDQDGDEEPAR